HQLHHARQKLGTSTATLRTIIHFDLDETRLGLLVLMHRIPFGCHRLHDEITRFIRAAKGDRQFSAIFIHNPTWNILLLTPQIIMIRLVVPASTAATWKRPNLLCRFPIATPASPPS